MARRRLVRAGSNEQVALRFCGEFYHRCRPSHQQYRDGWGVFYAKSYFSLTQINEPLPVLDSIHIGGPVSLVAGVLLIILGIREYRHGHPHGNHNSEHSHQHKSHDHESTKQSSHDHSHGDAHEHPQSQGDKRFFSRLKSVPSFSRGHSQTHESSDNVAERGLFGIAWFAFLFGFAHEEE